VELEDPGWRETGRWGKGYLGGDVDMQCFDLLLVSRVRVGDHSHLRPYCPSRRSWTTPRSAVSGHYCPLDPYLVLHGRTPGVSRPRPICSQGHLSSGTSD